MKILLGQSYYRALDPKEFRRNMPYPPLGSIYAATILKKLGHEIIFFDSMLSNGPVELIETLLNEKPDLFIIYDDEFNYLTKMCLSNMRDAAISAIMNSKELSIPVIIYSSDATDFSLPYLKAGCDAIIYGEGEITLQEVVDSFQRHQFYIEKKKINGLKFWDNENIFITKGRKLITDLDSMPNPDYSFVNLDLYKNIWINNHGYFSLNISTTRGCPFSCNWCAKPLYGRSYTSRSPKKVADQINEIKLKYGAEHFWMTDDIFGLKTNWIKEFGLELDKLNLKIRYKCLSRPDLLLKGDTISHLKKSGCETIWIGAESGSQKILDAMDKGTNVQQIYETAGKIHNAGMQIAFFIQFGYSGENWKDILLTREMIRRCLPEDIGISVSYPLPGTIFYERIKEQVKDKTNWQDSDDLDPLFTGTYERGFYKTLHRLVHSEYRLVKSIRQKNRQKILSFIFNAVKFIFFRIKISPYLFKLNSLYFTKT